MTPEDTEKLFAAMLGIVIFWAPLVTALTEFAKRMRPTLPTEVYPALALVAGLAIGIVYVAAGDVRMGVLYGFAIALTSAGLYSGGKAVLGKS